MDISAILHTSENANTKGLNLSSKLIQPPLLSDLVLLIDDRGLNPAGPQVIFGALQVSEGFNGFFSNPYGWTKALTPEEIAEHITFLNAKYNLTLA